MELGEIRQGKAAIEAEFVQHGEAFQRTPVRQARAAVDFERAAVFSEPSA